MSDPTPAPPSPRELPDKHTPTTGHETVEMAEVGKEGPKSADAPSINPSLLIDHALHFLATASNETLGACLVGLSAGTYLVLGRVGLVLIGVVGGVVLHATWEGQTHNDGDGKPQGQEVRRREQGIDVVHRVLQWRDKAAENGQGKDKESNHDVKLYAGKALDYSEFRPETAAALTELTDAVIRDYVKYVKDRHERDKSNIHSDGGIRQFCLRKNRSQQLVDRP